MKNKFITLSLFGIIFGRILNRLLSSYFGANGSTALITTIAVIFLIFDLYYLIRTRLFAALVIFIFAFPLIIGAIGMCLDNMTVVLCSICSNFIIIPIFIRWIKGLDYIDKSFLWKHKGKW
jgi:uncharacterized membrane protein YoaK (UPF0700 family)